MFRGIKHGRCDGFFNGDKIRCTPSFEREVKPSAPYRKIFQRVKNNFKCEQRYFEGKIHHFLCQVPHKLLLDDYAGRIA
jgi:hypothetical protein